MVGLQLPFNSRSVLIQSGAGFAQLPLAVPGQKWLDQGRGGGHIRSIRSKAHMGMFFFFFLRFYFII